MNVLIIQPNDTASFILAAASLKFSQQKFELVHTLPSIIYFQVRICFEKPVVRLTRSPSPDVGLSSRGPPNTSIVFGLSGAGDPIPVQKGFEDPV